MSRVLKRFPSEPVTPIKSGQSVYLFDEKGNRYLDMASNAMMTNLGYGNERIISAMQRQAKTLAYTHNGRYTHEKQEELARQLSDLAGGNYYLYFCGSGSEAIEASLRITYAYHAVTGNPHRTKVLANSKSYHGSSLGSLSVTGLAKIRGAYEPILSEHYFVNVLAGNVNELSAGLERKDVGGFLIEPMSSNAMGSVMIPEDFMRFARGKTAEQGQLLIFDEISTAIARTGRTFVYEYIQGLEPDLICLSKGIGVGYANIGAVLVKQNIAEAIMANDITLLGHAYNGHPIGCAVGLEVLQIIKEENYVQRNKEKGHYLRTEIQKIAERTPYIKEVRGRGLLLSFELAIDGQPFDVKRKMSLKVYRALLERGVVTLPGSGALDGRTGDHITLAPAFCMSYAEMDVFLEVLEGLFQQFEQTFDKEVVYDEAK